MRILKHCFPVSSLLLAALLGLSSSWLVGEDELLRLPVGDPSRSQRSVIVKLDQVVDTSTGQVIGLEELAAALDDSDILLVGENHTSAEFHRVQLRVLELLVGRSRGVLLGLEMFPSTRQRPLSAWTDGQLTEKGFLAQSKWYDSWGYNWLYYRDIFLLTRQHQLPIFGSNIPREVVRLVGAKGLAELDDREAYHLPEKIDTQNEDHLRLFKAFFPGDNFHATLSDERWQRMFEAQCTWDAAMAAQIVRRYGESDTQDKIMVLLVGAGHVAYGLGVERQARLTFPGKIASIIPVVIPPDSESVEIQASYANFLWGIPEEAHTRYPALGTSLTFEEGSNPKVAFVGSESPAGQAGVLRDDVVLRFAGHAVTTREDLNRRVAEMGWGDRTTLIVMRGEEEIELVIEFRRR